MLGEEEEAEVEEVEEREEGVKDNGGQPPPQQQAACGGGPGYNGGQQQQCDGGEAAIDCIWESYHLEGAELDWYELVEFLADKLFASRRQDDDFMVGVLAVDVDEPRQRQQYDVDSWAQTFPVSAYMADIMKPAATTPPTPSGSGTAAPELTQASSSPAATTSSMRSPGTPRAAGEPPPLPRHHHHRQRLPLRCAEPTCTRAFKYSRDLKRHVYSVHDKIKITCPRCGKDFKGDRRDNLLRHLKTIHGVS